MILYRYLTRRSRNQEWTGIKGLSWISLTQLILSKVLFRKPMCNGYKKTYSSIPERYHEEMENSQGEGMETRKRMYSSPIIGPIKADVALGYTPSGLFQYLEVYFHDREGKPVSVNPRRIAQRDVDTTEWALRLYDWHDVMWSLIPGKPTWNARHTRLI